MGGCGKKFFRKYFDIRCFTQEQQKHFFFNLALGILVMLFFIMLENTSWGQAVINDWFDVAPEPISVKNRHLINITKPIGINTIGSSLKIATHDIRGTPSQPKNIVAPWLLSSIQPDINLKPLF